MLAGATVSFLLVSKPGHCMCLTWGSARTITQTSVHWRFVERNMAKKSSFAWLPLDCSRHAPPIPWHSYLPEELTV